LSFSTQNIKTNGENKHISDLFPKNVFTVSPQPYQLFSEDRGGKWMRAD
jgi:hypothetical protein